jgi:hypothetical protein
MMRLMRLSALGAVAFSGSWLTCCTSLRRRGNFRHRHCQQNYGEEGAKSKRILHRKNRKEPLPCIFSRDNLLSLYCVPAEGSLGASVRHSVNVKRMPLEKYRVNQHDGTTRVAALKPRPKFRESEMGLHMLLQDILSCRVANNQSCLTRLLDLIGILQLN